VIGSLKSRYKANESITLAPLDHGENLPITLALLDAGGNLITGATNTVSAKLQSSSSVSSVLKGKVESEAKHGYAVFTDLTVTGKVGTGQIVQIQFSTPSLDKASLVSTLTPEFTVVGGDPFTLDVILETISNSAPNPEFEAKLTLKDFYGNPATIPARSVATVSSLPDSAGNVLSMVETTVEFVDSSGILHPKIQPSKTKGYLLRFGGFGLTVDKTFVVVPGTPAALKVVYKDLSIVAWEPFRVDAAAVDEVDNVLLELGNTANLIMSLSTMDGIEILSQNGGVGCTAVMRNGIASFGACAVKNSMAVHQHFRCMHSSCFNFVLSTYNLALSPSARNLVLRYLLQ